MEKENVRFYIKVRHALGIDALTIYEELRSYAGDLAPSHSTVKRWCKLFRRGRELLVDDPRSGRPYARPVTMTVECLNLAIGASKPNGEQQQCMNPYVEQQQCDFPSCSH